MIRFLPSDKPPLNQNSGPIFADFCEGNTDYRRRCDSENLRSNFRHGQYTSKSPIIKAVTISGKPREETIILDCTGGRQRTSYLNLLGLGTDSFVLASMGFNVHVFERDPIIYSLLRDGYERGLQVHDNIDRLMH